MSNGLSPFSSPSEYDREDAPPPGFGFDDFDEDRDCESSDGGESMDSGSSESVDCPPAKRKRGVDYHTERALRRWHLTSNTVVSGLSQESTTLADLFRRSCKHYCFQLELGEITKRLHYQCRVSFDPPVRKAQVIDMFPDFHIRPESNRGEQAGGLYVMKAATREDGPWSDKDVEVYKDPRYVLEDLRPWQQEVMRRMNAQDHRTITIVVDPAGNSGKTVLSHHLVQYHKGVFVPSFLQSGDDIMQYVCSHVTSGGDFILIIDIPRAALVPKLAPRLFSALEALKGGWAYDKRYKGTHVYFKPPRIVCFTNVMPNRSLLTGDRWDVMTLPWPAPSASGPTPSVLAPSAGGKTPLISD